MYIKKANAHKSIFDQHNTASGFDGTSSEYLEKAITLYGEIISKYPNSFLAYVYLTQANLDKQLIKPENSRDYSTVTQNYKKVVEIKNQNKNLSSIALSQFSVIKKQMQSIGLEAK